MASGLTDQINDLAARLEELQRQAAEADQKRPDVQFLRAAEGLMPRQVRLIVDVEGVETAATLTLGQTVELQATLLTLMYQMVGVSPYDELAGDDGEA